MSLSPSTPPNAQYTDSGGTGADEDDASESHHTDLHGAQ